MNRTVNWKRVGILTGVIALIAIDTLVSLRYERVIFPKDDPSAWFPFTLVIILCELVCIPIYLLLRDLVYWLFPKKNGDKPEEKQG